MKRFAVMALGTTCALASAQQQEMSLGQQSWFQKNVLNRLQWSGQRTLGFHQFRFEGDAESFNALTNFGTGLQTFSDTGNITVRADKLFDFVSFDAQFTDNRFSDPEQQRTLLNYKRGGLDLNYGTIRASLTGGNQFVSFNRSLDGFSGGFKKGRFDGRFISSDARGAARTITVEGNNTSGPFYLQTGRIISDSLQVQVDGKPQVVGQDYVADNQLGTITFLNKVIAPTSTINASYESFDFGGQRGSIRGTGFTYDLGWAGRLGFTSVEQLTGDSNSNSIREEKSFGFGRPGDQYYLQFEPEKATIRITVNGIPRTFSVLDDGISDFYLDPRLPILIISRIAIPTTQEIIFSYRPKVIQTASGDRQVTGLDYTVFAPGSKTTYIKFSQASGLVRGLNPNSGIATGYDLKIDEGKGAFTAQVKKIEPGFSSIEQTGFNRNEDRVQYGLDYFTKGLTSRVGTYNTSVTTFDNSTGAPRGSTRVVDDRIELEYSDPNNRKRNVNHRQSLRYARTSSEATESNILRTLGFGDEYRYKKLNVTAEVEKQDGRSRISNKLQDFGVNTFRTTVGYDASSKLRLTASASQSAIKTEDESSLGYDYSFGANLLDTGPWSGSLVYALSDSGTLASLGLTNGNGFGFGNNGFSTGTDTVSTGQLRSRRFSLTGSHQVKENMLLNFGLIQQNSEGLSTSNADLKTLVLGMSWRPNDVSNFNLDWSRSNTSFLSGSTPTSSSSSIDFNYNTSPGRFWSFNLGYNLTDSSGGSFAQSSLNGSFGAGYRINDRQRLFLNAILSNTRGFFPQDDISLNAGYSYQLISGIALTGRYTFRDLVNLDPNDTAGAFRSNGLSLELTFDFSSRR
ncbi:MAG: hypothetical protein WCK51_05390 [Armatimonadota bacterium]